MNNFSSKRWVGRTSDQVITENSCFWKYFQYADVITGDIGFNIAETPEAFGAKLEIPSFTKGQSQLRPEEVEDTRTIANVPIHVELVIRNLRKKSSILNGAIPIDFLVKNNDEKVTILDKIVHTSWTLINLCLSVVPLE